MRTSMLFQKTLGEYLYQSVHRIFLLSKTGSRTEICRAEGSDHIIPTGRDGILFRFAGIPAVL